MTPTSGKIAASLPREQIDEARRAVAEGRAPNVSAYVSEALRRFRRGESPSALIAALLATSGKPSETDYAGAYEAIRGGR
jgi:antitoxin ParD1/3/4